MASLLERDKMPSNSGREGKTGGNVIDPQTGFARGRTLMEAGDSVSTQRRSTVGSLKVYRGSTPSLFRKISQDLLNLRGTKGFTHRRIRDGWLASITMS